WKVFGIWRARAGRTEKKLAAVRERHIAGVRPLLGMIARLVAVDDDLGSRWERILIDAASQKRVRTSALHHPNLLGSILFGYFDVNPRVGIDPFDFHDLAFEQDRKVGVEFRSEGMMSRRRPRSRERCEPRHGGA